MCFSRETRLVCPNIICNHHFRPSLLVPERCTAVTIREACAQQWGTCGPQVPGVSLQIMPSAKLSREDTKQYTRVRLALNDRFEIFRRTYGEDTRLWRHALQEFGLLCLTKHDTLLRCNFDPFITTSKNFRGQICYTETLCEPWLRQTFRTAFDERRWWCELEALGSRLLYHRCSSTRSLEDQESTLISPHGVIFRNPFAITDNYGTSPVPGGSALHETRMQIYEAPRSPLYRSNRATFTERLMPIAREMLVEDEFQAMHSRVRARIRPDEVPLEVGDLNRTTSRRTERIHTRNEQYSVSYPSHRYGRLDSRHH